MHVVVTGASAGIGEAIAREYGNAGAKLTLVARRKEKLDALAAEFPGSAQVFAADLTDVEHATDWLTPAEAAFGPTDVLVNNAGVQIIGYAHEGSIEPLEDLLRLNVLTPMRLTRAIIPGTTARGSGAIVDIASLAALSPLPAMYYYNAAKGALANASEGLRGELARHGIHVLTVYPGPVETEMARKGYAAYRPSLTMKMMSTGRPDVLARMIRKGVEKRRARIIYPRVYATTLWFPRITRWFTAHFTPPLKQLT
jgi:short-subunit dehydrogenase